MRSEARSGAAPVPDTQGSDGDVTATVTADRGDRQSVEEQLLDSEQRFRSLFESAPLGILLADLDGRLVRANAALCRMLDRRESDLLGGDLADLMDPTAAEDAEARLADVATARTDGFTIETRYLRGDSSTIHARTTSSPMRDATGQPAYIIAVVEDITDRLRLEELEARQRELELIAAHTEQLQSLNRAAILINTQTSLDQMLLTITEQARAIIGAHLGATSLTVPGAGPEEGWPQQDITVSVSDKYASFRAYDEPSRGSPVYGLVCDRNDVVRMTDDQLKSNPAWRDYGSEHDRHPPLRGWLAAPLIARDGTNLGILQLSDRYDGDFTPTDEALLVQLAQMASVAVEKAHLYALEAGRAAAQRREELLAGISHDMQTPIAAIVGFIDALSFDDIPNVDRDEMLTVLRRQSRRLRALVQQFLDFSRLEGQRPLAVDLRPIDVVPVIERVVELFEHQHEFIVGAEAGLARAVADGNRLEQVLTNLVANAVKFSDRPVRVVARRSGDHVLIEVIDEGDGISESELELVFEKFYRGDGAGGTSGSGLGLYVARALTEAQGGELSVSSTVGVGTRFRILLERETPT